MVFGKKFTAVLLAGLLLLSQMPVHSAARSVTAPEETISEGIQETAVISGSRGIVEVEALREENVKHFALPDGTYQAVVYSEAVHRRDEAGRWQEIDNSLTLRTTRGIRAYGDENGRMAFSESVCAGQQVFALDDGNHQISMSLPAALQTEVMTARVSEAQVTNGTSRRADVYTSLEEAARFDSSGKVLYADALPGIDLAYTLKGNNVKEEIIVKAPAQSYSYRFVFTVEGLYAVQEEDGSISLFDSETQERAYVIPTPLMYDANETVSYDVSYTLTGSGDTYELTVTADEAWINAEDRAWPVTIDPTIMQDTFLYDTFIRSTYPDATHGGASALWLSRTPSSVGITEVLIKGNMPQLPAGSMVTNAYMQAWYYYNDNVTTGTFDIGVYPVYSYWGEYSITWRNAQSLSMSSTKVCVVGTSAANHATINSPGEIIAPMTNLVKGWITGSVLNNGVKLKYESGTNLSVTLRSSESGATYSPHFYVEYQLQRFPDGVYEMTNTGQPKNACANGPLEDKSVIQVTDDGIVSRNELFKITYVGTQNGEDYYVIRSMLNNELGLSAPVTGGGVSLAKLPVSPTLANVPKEQRWAISYTEGRHVIRNGTPDEGAYLCDADSLDTQQLLRTRTTEGAGSAWLMTAHDGGSGIEFVQTSNWCPVGSTFVFKAVMWDPRFDVNGPVTYSVRNVDNSATDKAAIDPNTGLLTVQKPGYVKIGATYEDADETVWYTVGLYTYGPVTVQFVYDGGYAERYDDAQSRIQSQAAALQEYYLNHFGLLIFVEGISQFESYADLCNSECNCNDNWCMNGKINEESGLCEAYGHHKNLYNILYEIERPVMSNHVIIAYTGHNFCYVVGNEHMFDMHVLGLTYVGKRVSVIAGASNGGVYEQQTLIHELAHSFGAEDHYDNEDDGYADYVYSTNEMNNNDPNGPYKDDCIYGLNSHEGETASDYTICPGCRSAIIECLNDVFGQG